jgi:hypothetical protein
MTEKIFPRNLTARAERRVTGNPDSTRFESGVANCFPGLEFDHRNLDRRFFPGLVFDFNSNSGAADLPRTGARLVQVDADDSDLNPGPDAAATRRAAAQALRQALSGDTLTALGTGNWFLDKVTQGGQTISMSLQPDGSSSPQDGLVVWRLVRSLEPGPEVEIVLVQRPASPAPATTSPTPVSGPTPSATPGSPPTPAPPPSVTLKGCGVISQTRRPGSSRRPTSRAN